MTARIEFLLGKIKPAALCFSLGLMGQYPLVRMGDWCRGVQRKVLTWEGALLGDRLGAGAVPLEVLTPPLRCSPWPTECYCCLEIIMLCTLIQFEYILQCFNIQTVFFLKPLFP